ncbi:hypothetical protein ELH06_12430 [Rhizobium ruizarguesonis]|uniref:hypothetical protein n=1 Tax=Rhizobium ruizarguesonis TaxID=2081791 RepID=UPI0010311264|nr:hypothetical protein [Rhizobium ruizarguesonis]TBE49911.1 hypothetical protein ELH06_12430 [Rhizobium ruizarguesonis]
MTSGKLGLPHSNTNRPEEVAWIKAHPAIRRTAYGVLILITLASAFLAITRGGMGPAIISIVVVVVLCLVVLGLIWIAERKEKLWQWVGAILIITALTAIVALFLTILIYIGTGYPVWLDVWFGPALTVDAPKEVKVSKTDVQSGGFDLITTGAISSTSAATKAKVSPVNVVRHDDGSFEVLSESKGPSVRQDENKTSGLGLIRDRRSPGMIAPIATYERQIQWDKNVYKDVTMEVEVSSRGGGKYHSTTREDGQLGAATINGLFSNEFYEYKITALRKGRRSLPVTGCFATPLDFYVDNPQPYWAGYITYYSAERECDGKIQADNGSIIYEAPQYYEEATNYRIKHGPGVARWIYNGEIRDSKPTWNGTLYADPVDCVGNECGSKCELFNGVGTCNLFFKFVSVNGMLYGGAQSYYHGTINLTGSPSRSLGPVGYSFKVGDLEAVDTDYSDVYSGDWENNDVKRIANANLSSISGFRTGALFEGKVVENSSCFLAVFPSGAVVGAGVRATCASFEVGEYRGNKDPYNGFQVDLTEGSPVYLYRSGVTTVLSPPMDSDTNSCVKSYEFGLTSNAEWPLKCSTDDGRQCTIRNNAIDTELRFSVSSGNLPNIQFLTTESGGKDDFVSIDGKPYDVAPRSSKDAQLSSMAMLAQMCSGKMLKTNFYPDSVALNDLCTTAAVAFARLLTCR